MPGQITQLHLTNLLVSSGFASYVSDPAKPVPYRTQPIEATYGTGSRWRQWQVEDQRFVYSRPDVISFTMDSLTDDLTVTGKIMAHLFASTTGTDADWVVKLIDVYPNFDSKKFNHEWLPVTGCDGSIPGTVQEKFFKSFATYFQQTRRVCD